MTKWLQEFALKIKLLYNILMRKNIISLVVLIGLFCLVGFAFAVTIPDPLNGQTVTGLLRRIAKEVGTLISYLGVIMIIVAGILYLTSAGSPERINKAKTALIYAIAGIAIGIAAQAIVEIIGNIIGVEN